jgi:hypothetical protein
MRRFLLVLILALLAPAPSAARCVTIRDFSSTVPVPVALSAIRLLQTAFGISAQLSGA